METLLYKIMTAVIDNRTYTNKNEQSAFDKSLSTMTREFYNIWLIYEEDVDNEPFDIVCAKYAKGTVLLKDVITNKYHGKLIDNFIVVNAYTGEKYRFKQIVTSELELLVE